jgi:glycosyltransferase involved in cell wall biosynthesis
MSGARITVGIPCYNDHRFVADAVRSVQEDEPVEIVVVDDGSDDPRAIEALAGLPELGARLVRRDVNAGLGAARNTLLAEARTPYLFNLDSDDLGIPGRFAAMADRLDADPAAVVCYGGYEEFGAHSSIRDAPSWLDPFRLAWISEYPPSALWRIEPIRALGGWPEVPQSRAIYEDWRLWATLSRERMPTVYLGRGVPSYRRRLHGESQLSLVRRRHRAAWLDIHRHHPELLRDLRRNRRLTDLPLTRQLVFPIFYGPRPRFAFEPKVRFWLERHGVRTASS